MGRCSEQTTVVTPKTCDPAACGEGMVCKNNACAKKDVGTVTPPTNPCSDTQALGIIEKSGDDDTNAGSYAAALAKFDQVFKCRPGVASKAYLAACKARNFAKAKVYFKFVGKDALAQICLKEGFDPRL